jgi:hypothetical protein
MLGMGTKETATALSNIFTITTSPITSFSRETAICPGSPDLVWLDNESYNPVTGAGSVGVEFAGSAVSSPCPYGQNISLAAASNYSSWLVHANPELQWQDVCTSPDSSSEISRYVLTIFSRLSWLLRAFR